MRYFLCPALMLILCCRVEADFLVFDNQVGGAGGLNFSLESDSAGGFFQADDVQVGFHVTVERVEWTGLYAFGNTPSAVDNFTINFHSNSGGPGVLLQSAVIGNAVNRVDTGIDLNGSRVFSYSAQVNLQLDAGVSYQLSIVNRTFDDEDDTWYWGSEVESGNNFRSPDQGETWIGDANSLDFRLFAVPEPCSIHLMWVVFGTAATRRRRHRS